MLEKDIEKYLKRRVEQRGGLCLKFVSPGSTGVPDRLCVFPEGRIAFVETKTKRGKLSPRQQYVIGELQKLRAEVVVLHDTDEVDIWLDGSGKETRL